jgi:F-type H+-transporting ATPase subunit epsilon
VADTLYVIRVVSPERVAYQGEATGIVAPAWDGRVGILPNHAPFITLLGAGHLIVDRPDGAREAWWVAGGALKVERNEVTVLTEFTHHEEPEELPAGVLLNTPEDFLGGGSALNPLA